MLTRQFAAEPERAPLQRLPAADQGQPRRAAAAWLADPVAIRDVDGRRPRARSAPPPGSPPRATATGPPRRPRAARAPRRQPPRRRQSAARDPPCSDPTTSAGVPATDFRPEFARGLKSRAGYRTLDRMHTADIRPGLMKAITVIPGAGRLGARSTTCPSPTEARGRGARRRRSRSGSAAPTARSCAASTAGRRRARSGWCWGTSRWAACARRRRARGFAAGDLVVGIVRRPDPVPCARARPASGTSAANGAVHRARDQAAARLRLGALARRAGVRDQARPGARGRRRAARADHAWWPRRGSRSSGSARGRRSRRGRVLVTGAGPIGLLAALLGRAARPRGARARPGAPTGRSRSSWRGSAGPTTRSDASAAGHGPTSSSRPPASPAVVAAGAARHRPQRDRVPHRRLAPAGGRSTSTSAASTATSCSRTTSCSAPSTPTAATTRRPRRRSARPTATGCARLITRRVPLDRWQEALERQPDDVKVVVELS